MKLHPILAALRKHKAGATLIALQIALTLAIVCNALFIISQRMERIRQPTGLQENDLFLITQQWVNAPSTNTPSDVTKLDGLQLQDLDVLRSIPQVAMAAPINSLPLLGTGMDSGVALKPFQQKSTLDAYVYNGDEKTIPTLGLRLIAGREFNVDEIRNKAIRDKSIPPVAIVTKSIADKLFPSGNAIGGIIFLSGQGTPTTIIGVLDRLQSTVDDGHNPLARNSIFLPFRLNGRSSRYVVRAKPGQLITAMQAARTSLYGENSMRILDDNNVKSFADIRADAGRADEGMAILMSVICLVLLAVTTVGIVGLTSFWVNQRRRQIGVRRALGARKIDILRYFLIENMLVAGGGALVGLLLAIGLNMLLMNQYEMDRLPPLYLIAGIFMVLILGQCAAFMPAYRASKVAPISATRLA